MPEGSLKVDPVIALELQRLSLKSAQELVLKTANEQIDDNVEEKLRHERAVELLKRQIRDAADERDQKSSSLMNARQHIENLDIIQQAEKVELDEMQSTILQWRVALRKKPNKEEENEIRRQEKLLQLSIKEWQERENELTQLKMRLDGSDLASI